MGHLPRLRERNGSRTGKAGRRPTLLIVTRDGELFGRLAATAPESWTVEACIAGHLLRGVLADHDVRLAVVDDAGLFESERTGLLATLRRLAPESWVLYIASEHSAARERAVRSQGVVCYTSQPADLDRLERVLRSGFAREDAGAPKGTGQA